MSSHQQSSHLKSTTTTTLSSSRTARLVPPLTNLTYSSPPPTPSRILHSRVSSPGASTVTDSTSFWQITESNGCLPSLSVAYDELNDAWWGDPLPEPLNLYEDLVNKRLPSLIHNYTELSDEISKLPEMNLFASQSQFSHKQLERSSTPGHEHDSTCPNRNDDDDVGFTVVLHFEAQRERSFACLAFLANALIHNSPPMRSSSQAKVLPRKIAEPLQRIASFIGRLPVTDYASSVLTNWKLIDNKLKLSIDNLQIIRTFTGSESERWFFAIHVCIEHLGGKALIAILDAKEEITRFLMLQKLQGLGKAAIERGAALQNFLAYSAQFSVKETSSTSSAPPLSVEERGKLSHTTEAKLALSRVGKWLKFVYEALIEINEVINRLSEKCPPEVFFDEIRGNLGSWPDPGVLYETGCSPNCQAGRPLILKLAGASGAQSSLFPGIDGFLGVSYAQSEMARTDLGEFVRMLKKFRQSMPPSHRQMVNVLETSGNCRELIAAVEEIVYKMPLGDALIELENELLNVKTVYNEVLEKLVIFRRSHSDYAVKYIKTMARDRARNGSSSSSSMSSKEIKGTGGSDFATHLQRHIVDTKKSMYVLQRLRGPGIHKVESLEQIWGIMRP